MIIDVHTHLSTREQWGKVFVEAFDRDTPVTPGLTWK